MKFKIEDSVFQKFSGLSVGVLVVRNINNFGESSELHQLIREQESRIRAHYSAETLSENPEVNIWRKAYAEFGGKPKENKSSVESLYRLVLNGNSLRHINKLVDVYNYISLKHFLPVGGEDLDKIKGDVTLTFASSVEKPVVLLGDSESRPPHEGEVVYKDDDSTICRRWNWREADRTKLTEQTKNCILVIEGLSPMTKQKIEDTCLELQSLIKKFCGGKNIVSILNQEKTEIVI